MRKRKYEEMENDDDEQQLINEPYPSHNILIIDPGWKNLGCIGISIDTFSKSFRIFSDVRSLNLPVTQKNGGKETDSELLSSAINQWYQDVIVNKFGMDTLFDIIIEKQPYKMKKNVKLEDSLITTLITIVFNNRIRVGRVLYRVTRISAIKVKNYLGLSYGEGNHKKHKNDIVQLMQDDEIVCDPKGRKIFFKEVVKNGNDHIADCVGLFHVFAHTYKYIRNLANDYSVEII